MRGDELHEALDALGNLGDAVAATPQREPLPEYPPARTGRPAHYTPATAQLVCDMIADGYTVAEIAQREGMPSRHAIADWAARVPEFGAALTRARGKQATAIAERGFAQAWDPDLQPEHVQRARLRFDAARWLASTIDPARYGSRADLSVTVTDPDTQQRAAQQRQELIAALQRLAVPAPLVIEGDRPSD
jgi:hypothetical protein